MAVLQQISDNDSEGTTIGQSATSKIAFYGATPVVRPAAAGQALIVDASGGVAAPTNGILTLTGTYNSTILANAIATMVVPINEIRNALVSVGIMKGSA
jgi:hypothetical protein